MCWPCYCQNYISPQISFIFNEFKYPLTVDINLEFSSILSNDSLCLVPSNINFSEIAQNFEKIKKLLLRKNPKSDSRGTYILQNEHNLPKKYSYYFAYIRKEFENIRILGISKNFIYQRKISKISHSSQNQSLIIGQNKSVEEWKSSLLNSARQEDENERNLILELFEKWNSKNIRKSKPKNTEILLKENNKKWPNVNENNNKKTDKFRGILKNITNQPIKSGNEYGKIKCFSFIKKMPIIC